MQRKFSIPFTIFLVMAFVLGATLPVLASAGGNGGNTDSNIQGPRVDTTSALVQLRGDPLSTYVKTKPPQGKKIDFSSNSVKSYRAQLSAQRNDFKQWLQANAPKAKITGQYDISLNAVAVQLNGTSLAKLAGAPMVQHVEYEGLYYPTDEDPDLALISAFDAWNVGGGAANAGAGVKVAILDTGIDITHPCFSDAGYPAQTQLGDHNFTNNKVIVAKVFQMQTPGRGYTAEALQEHGTHVAGTVACNYNTPATVDGVAISHGISGVAPRALLGNYNIFPGQVDNAHSEDILNALDAAYADGFDVANMSLGGGASGIQDLLTMAVDNLDVANMVVAVAAGNSGPGYYTVESPGSAARALTAGAASVGHGLYTTVTVGGTAYDAVRGDFGQYTVSGPLAVLEDAASIYGGLSTACSSIAENLTGEIALISRGVCDFSVKVRNVQDAGALGVVVVNREPGVFVMGQNGTPNQPTIPAYMVDVAHRDALMASEGSFTSFDAAFYAIRPADNDIMADFSSQGPTDVDFRVKPDVVAPGVNVLSSIPHQFCAAPPCFAFFQGTSMATPHLAGSAAVVRWLHPDWTAAEVRSAIVNTADQNVLRNYDAVTPATDVNIIGAGRENLFSAVNASVAIDPVSISFGAIPSGAGQTRTFAVTLTNLGGAATLNVAVGAGNGGVSYSVDPSTLTLSASESKTLTVTMSADKGAAFGGHSALLTVSSGGTEVAHAVVYTFIK
jgi:subtilisin family serine protease